MTEQDRTALTALIKHADELKAAYFFSPPGSAGQRRQYERRHKHERIEWEDGGHTYSAKLEVSCSCKNVYVYADYTKDGKRTNLTAIRNSAIRMGAWPGE